MESQINKDPIVFIALLRAAMHARNKYINGQADYIASRPAPKSRNPSYQNKINREHKEATKRQLQQIKQFNIVAYREIEKMEKLMTRAGAESTDTLASFMHMLITDYVNIEDKEGLLVIVQLFKEGMFEHTLNKIREANGMAPKAKIIKPEVAEQTPMDNTIIIP